MVVNGGDDFPHLDLALEDASEEVELNDEGGSDPNNEECDVLDFF